MTTLKVVNLQYAKTHPDSNKSVVHRFDNVKPGTIIVFYSGLWHKVYPIKSGIRKSLVGWTLGQCFSNGRT